MNGCYSSLKIDTMLREEYSLDIVEFARGVLPTGLIESIGAAYSYAYGVINSYLLRCEYLVEVLGAYLLLELLLPRTRPSWRSNLRSLRFVLANLLITVLFFSFFPWLVDLNLINSFRVIDLTPLTTSAFWPLRILGFAVAAFGAAFLGNFIYYWFHRAQHVVPVLWRFHKIHHSIRELSAVNS